MILNMISYIMGLIHGKRHVILEGSDYTFTDDGDGNISITEE